MRVNDRLRHGGLVVVVAAVVIALGALPGAADDAVFPLAPSLRPQVDFWIKIFTEYGKRQMVFHDVERLDRVYSVIDYSDLDREGMSEVRIELAMKAAEEAEKERLRALLRRLDRMDPQDTYLTQEEQRLVMLFADDRSPNKFSAAADRLRGQRGLRERFARGLQVAHAYFPAMERIFRQEGVPAEITRLPLVESCFDVNAYSKVGAAGVWQFMPGTARNYMRVDGVVDERLDPIIATRGAARFLHQSYRQLGTWPLAIKAYNHGPAGIARAVRTMGTTDPAAIIANYQGPAYKFASRNFYPEFLAALEVERNHEKYFGDLPLHPPLLADTVYLPRSASLASVARCAGAESWNVASLNPSLLAPVRNGRPIPQGHELRLPAGTGDHTRACLASLPAAASTVSKARSSSARPGSGGLAKKGQARLVHKVKRGQTLGQIASRYGCSVDQLRRYNKLRGNKVQAGQVLRIPAS